MIYEDFNSVNAVDVVMLKGDRGEKGDRGNNAAADFSDAEYLALACRLAEKYQDHRHLYKAGDFMVYNYNNQGDKVWEAAVDFNSAAEEFDRNKWIELGPYTIS